MTLDEAIRQLRTLNEPVPEPLRLPTPQEVSAVEQRLAVQFHPDFRKYLLEASDIVFDGLEPVTITRPKSPTDLEVVCAQAWDEWEIPRRLLPICEDNGDYYCMNARGEIIFWSHIGPSQEKWRDLATWIEQVWIGEAM
ncbi:MAG: SMI1/KNR4 family protein [Bacillota bacterium]